MTLYRKYRPEKFADLVGQDPIRDTLMQAVKEGKLSQAYLLTGPRGTGKTTTARLIARVANCIEIDDARKAGKELSGEPCGKCVSCLEISQGKSLDIIEIDAASNRSIDDIRELRDQVRFAPAKSKFKVYIIDEVHMLTREAFNALLKTLEEPPAHAIFILATTEPHKVLPTIISRTQRFDFKRISSASLLENLKKVAKAEELASDNQGLEMIAALADGGGRDSLSLLEQVAAYSNQITSENVRTILGIVEISQIISLLRAIFNSNAEEGLKIAHSLFERGINLIQLNATIVDVLRKLLTYEISGSFLLAETEENKSQIIALGELLSQNFPGTSQSKILSVIKNFIDAGKIMKETIDPLVAIEIAVIESCGSAPSHSTKSVTKNTDEVPGKTKMRAETKSSVSVPNVTEKPKLTEAEDKQNFEPNPVQNAEAVQKKDLSETKMTDLPALLELDKEVWDSVIGEVKKENTSLAALLRDAKPMTVEAGKLVLGVRFKFHKDKISEAKNVQILEGVICNVTGNSCRVMCEIADFSQKKDKKSHSDDELAEEAEKIFGE